MKKMLRFVEVAWIVVSVISAVELFRRWPSTDKSFWIFLGFMILAIVMFFVRRKQRRAYERRQLEKDTRA